MKDNLIRNGDRGEEVRDLQQKLVQMGYQLDIDGIFGTNTERAVRELQTMFGYDVDGIVGPGTLFLINQQIGYGWNKNAPDAKQRATQAQGQGKGGGAQMGGQGMPAQKQMQPQKGAPGADGDGKWGKQASPQQPQQGGAPMVDKKAPAQKGGTPGKKI
jgi:peptidoglycan hydrolase-like protein with peptidoglycan-binding domain